MGYLMPLTVLNHNDAWRPVLCSLAPNCESDSCRMQCPVEYLATSLRRLAPREQRVRLGQQAALLQAIRSGRFDELWDPRTGP
jgi:type II secretory pathway component PulM